MKGFTTGLFILAITLCIISITVGLEEFAIIMYPHRVIMITLLISLIGFSLMFNMVLRHFRG